MRIVLLGPPGAGKGTQAQLLKKEFQLVHISTGDIFREEMKKNTSLGQDLKQYVDQGKLVPDEVVTQIVANRLKGMDPKEGYLLDGFPRTVHQAQDLDQILAQVRQPLDYCINMEASLPVIIQRLTGRRVCKQCGAVYHAVNRPPQKKDICDQCAGPLMTRADDVESTIRTRMKEYMANTAPIARYYEQQGKLIKIDADQDSEDVQQVLLKKFIEDGKVDHDQKPSRN